MKLIAFILLIVPVAYAQTADRFYGKFLGLQADSAHMYERVLSTTAARKPRFAPALPNSSPSTGC